MHKTLLGLAASLSLLVSPLVSAQEHTTDGPVWLLSCYQINDGQFDAYMTWLRTHNLPLQEARKKAGLIIDHKMFFSGREGPNDCDVTFATLYSSAGKAFDYDSADDAADDEITKKHRAQWSDEEATKAFDSRFAMRRFIRTSWVREATLKPIK